MHHWSPYVSALTEFFEGEAKSTLVVHNDFGEREEVAASHFFRRPSEFPRLESKALEFCVGRVLDVGAGAGCHSLALQERDVAVRALDVAPALCTLMARRGVIDVHCGDVFDIEAGDFNTLLLLMNGFEITGTLAGLERFLSHVQRLLNPDGLILADSTDLRPSYGTGDGNLERDDGRYVGEVTLQLEYGGVKGAPFPHLYVDPDTLTMVSARTGWNTRIVYRDGDSYLAQLTKRG